MSWCGSMRKVTTDGSLTSSGESSKVMTSSDGGSVLITLPTTSTMPEPSARRCSQVEPGCQSETLAWPQ